MGLRFDLNTANWLAYLLQPGAPMPQLENRWMEREALRKFLNRLEGGFYSSSRREREFHHYVHRALEVLEGSQYESGFPNVVLRELRDDLADRPWTALIIPSGDDNKIDRFLCSEDLLIRLVGIWAEDPGLLLQLEDGPQQTFSLVDVFPAFRVALANSTRWPGLLVWTRHGDAAFFAFGSHEREEVEARARFLLQHLSRARGQDLEDLQRRYATECLGKAATPSRIHLLQLSDIHLGCKEASRRLPRVQQLIRNLLAEFPESDTVVPIVSGDLMDNPGEDQLDRVRSFLDFLGNLGTAAPMVVLGNHDVRKDGYLAESLRQALQLTTNRLRTLEDEGVAIVGFNSVASGRLARGLIGEKQLLDIGNELDHLSSDYIIVGLLHHHPTPVDHPEWYVQRFYEKLFGTALDKTLELEDAETFLQFVEARSFTAILHGHKHIPRIDATPGAGVPIYGCGSTVGKVKTDDGRTYMSLNVVTIDPATGQLSGRLLGERIPGGGLVEERRHELVHRGRVPSRKEAA